MRRAARRAPLAVLVLPLLLAALGACADFARSEGRQGAALHELFRLLDSDGDGQIEAREATAYIRAGAAAGSAQGAEAAAAARHFVAQLDGSDVDDTISEAELTRSLSRRLQARRRLPRAAGAAAGQNSALGARRPLGHLGSSARTACRARP